MTKKFIIYVVFFASPFFAAAEGNLEFTETNSTYSEATAKVMPVDLNGDNLDDIVMTNATGIGVSLNSNSSFYSTHSYKTIDDKFKRIYLDGTGNYQYINGSQNTVDFAYGDVNNDGIKDIVAVNRGEPEYISQSLYGIPGGIAVLFGHTDATFELTQSKQFDYVNDNPIKVKLADIDGDGDLDMLTLLDSLSTTSVSIVIFKNDGNGVFTESNRVYLDAVPTSLGRVIDFNLSDVESDGDIDLLVTYNNEYRVYFNNGFGEFAQPVLYTALQSTLAKQVQRIKSFETLDIDKDGDQDVVLVMNVSKLVNPSSIPGYVNGVVLGQLGYYINNGNGIFTFKEGELLPLSVINNISVDDLNGDGNKDILANGLNTLTQSTEVYAFLGDAQDSNFISHKIISEPVASNSGYYFWKGTALNLNGDSRKDLLFFDNSGKLHTFEQVELHKNSAPVIAPISNKVIAENQQLNFTATASDPDGNAVTLSASGLPTGASFNAVTGEFDWLPTYADSGIYTVTIKATENTPEALVDTKVVAITVTNVNRPPVVSLVKNQVVTEGSTLSFTVLATDPDGDTVTLYSDNIPSGASLDANSGAFSWTPSFNDSGTYSVIFTAQDNSSETSTSSEAVTISVLNNNRPPILNLITNQTVLEGERVAFSVSATDPDDDLVLINPSSLPVGSSFDSTTGLFTWLTNLSNAGVYTITFTATDNGNPSKSLSQDVVITVIDKPTPAEQINNLLVYVNSLNIQTSVINSYIANLKKVNQFIIDGKITPALNQLTAFINKVNQDYSQNIITLQQKNNMVSSAEKIMHDLTNP